MMDGLALSLHFNSSQRCSIRPVKSIYNKLSHLCLYGPCFVHWCTVMLEQEGAIPKRSMEMSNISLYAEAFRVPFTETKRQSPAPEKQPYTIIPPPPNLHLAHCIKTSTVLLATAKPRLVYQI